MTQRTCIIESENSEEAALQGLERLGVEREQIQVTYLGDCSFQVDVVQAPYLLEVSLRKQGMEAVVERAAQTLGAGPVLGLQTLAEELLRLGVTVGVLQAEVEALLGELGGTVVIENTVVARGQAVVEATRDEVQLEANLGQILRHGDRIGGYQPGQPACPGINLAGEEVLPKDQARPAWGAGIRADVESLVWYCDVPGFGYLSQAEDGQYFVTPAISISGDRLTACIDLRHPVGEEKAIDRGELVSAIMSAGVVYGLDPTLLGKAWNAHGQTESDTGPFAIAHGTPVGPARDEEIVINPLPSARDSKGAAKDQVNYHELGSFRPVLKGERFATWYDPRSGEPGTGVDGSILSGPKGNPSAVRPGKHVEVLQLGSEQRILRARLGGVVCVKPDEISVVDMLMIKGDVGYDTGNLVVEGSLWVGGCIRSGFKVSVENDLHVAAAIEASEVRVGGSVHVERGVLGGDGGELIVGGDVSLGFAQNAVIQCGGDLEIRESEANSQLECGGKLSAILGRGGLRSGSYSALGGIEVIELGSELGAATFVKVGQEKELVLEFGSLIDELKRIKPEQEALGPNAELDLGGKLSPEEAKNLRESIKRRRDLRRRRSELELRLNQLKQALALARQPLLEVHGRVHTHVEISMAGKSIQSRGTEKSLTYRFDRARGEIASEPMLELGDA